MAAKILIDAGHNNSSFNIGAVGNGMREQDITFEVSKRLSELLTEQGLETKLSRPTIETNLGNNNASAINTRWQMSNSWGADYFISIHVNAGGGTGSETFINNAKSRPFATVVNDLYANEMGMRNRGVKTGNFAVVTHAQAPSILLELAFIDSPLSNPDVSILRDKREEMAKSIAKGIFKFLNITPKKPIEEELDMRFNTVQEVPEWGRATISKLIDKSLLNGDGDSLNLTEDMVRIFVINDRAGLYK